MRQFSKIALLFTNQSKSPSCGLIKISSKTALGESE